jgi:serine/threonine-protein kinase
MLDRYDLGDELGTGARSAVFRARERSTGRTVAVKLTPGASDAPAGGSVPHLPPHPNICTVHSSGERRGLHYSIAEFADGIDLGACTSGAARLPLRTVLYILERVASALDHAHRHGVVHGDVKPSNIFFDEASRSVKLGDWPASAAEADRRGTPAYLSPQRLCGMPASTSCDQFALGVTLYRLVCGRLPFAHASRIEMVHAAVHEPHADVSHSVPDAPAGLAAVLDRALAKQAAGRYRSIEELRLALRRLRARTSRWTAAG